MKSLGRSIFKKLNLLSFYSLKKSGYLYDKGWFQSFKSGMAEDRDGKPIPWMTYSFVDFLEPRLDKTFNVFEYGCGNSSLWWLERINKLTSCENNEEWYSRIKQHESKSYSLLLRKVEDGSYARSISEQDQTYDIIIIDGQDRVNCAKECVKQLKTNGVILWDNSDREEYAEGYQFLINQGFKRIDFYGLGPINVMAWSTSVFYKEQNCLGI